MDAAIQLTPEMLDRMADLITRLADAKQDKAEADKIKQDIINFMKSINVKTFRSNGLLMRLTPERQTICFDEKMLQQKYPDIWKECHSVQVRPDHLQIKQDTKKQTVIDEDPDEDEI